VPKKTFRNARTTTSTAGDSQTEASVPPSWPQLEQSENVPGSGGALLNDDIIVCPKIELRGHEAVTGE
jgi:hypothetical protein